MSGGRLSGRAAAALMAALGLLLSAAALLSAGLPLSGSDRLRSGTPTEPERALIGRNDPDAPALELLPGEKLNLNTATAEELRILPGIGDKLSAAIVAYREENGPFASVEDLLQVPGIGDGRLAAIRDLVTVGEDPPSVVETSQP